MNDVITKSLYCSLLSCDRYAWLSRHKPEKYVEKKQEDILQNGKEVGELARNLFGDFDLIEFNKNINTMIDETQESVERGTHIIAEASFRFENAFCSVDILKNDIDGVEVYEVKSSTEIQDIYLDDVAFQVYILKHLGYRVKKANIVYLNSEYVRHGDLELDKLFVIEDVTEIIKPREALVKDNITRILNNLNSKKEIKNDIDSYCFKPYECPFIEYCMKDLPKPNVFDIRRMKITDKLKLYKAGKISFEDLVNENINEKYLQQIDFELNDKDDYINKENIEDFLNKLSYPLYFLDFETYQQAIPLYDGISPYMQIPFQYSLHYINDNVLEHTEFLGEEGTDPRRKLALSLISDIKPDTCVLAYNMSFEKGVIKNLAKMYPDLSKALMNIHDNIVDLMVPFYNRDYYTKDMKGSYSIKYVLPALFSDDPSLNYHNLKLIHNGSEAMNAFNTLTDYDDEQRKIIRKNLLEYCKLDTFAMVKIWQKLNEICGKDINISI
ncbi:MAG: DUF2779 domain-containing protein [Bacilli bacterium]|nr:DUF2779 domain-containing protein [Bacilli bacterium]